MRQHARPDLPSPRALPALLALSLSAVPGRAQLILSEAMADPRALADAQGEFLEIANAGSRRESADSLRLAVDGDTVALGPVDLAPGAHLLLCRDSAAMAGAGAACARGLGGISLPNGRPLAVVLLWGALRAAFEVPAARPGVSWENTFDEEGGLVAFARAGRAFGAGDSATPGFRNSRSLRPARRDLRVAGLGEPALGILEVTIERRGADAWGGTLALRADRDWDGDWETPIAAAVPVPPEGGAVRLALDPDHLGLLRAELGEDEDPAGDAAPWLREAGRTLDISEACPAPEAGPEWAEIRNATGEGGGWPRALDLSRVEWDGRPLGPEAGRLGPGEFLIATEDAAALRALLGPLKVRLVEVAGWGSLRNTGDTCRLSFAGRALDSLAYGSAAAAATGCLSRAASGAAPVPAAPTPGYPAPPSAAARFALEVSARVLEPGSRLEIGVEAPPGSAFALRVFDLEGNVLRLVGRGGAGRHRLAWDGASDGGARVPPGPYVLGLSSGARRPLRKAVVVAGPR